MAKTKVKVTLPTLEKLTSKNVVNQRTADRLGRTIKKESLKLASVGKSPVAGQGRFKAYAAQRKGKGYPNIPSIKKMFPGKKVRPVNLFLDGSYLNALGHRKKGNGIEYGWLNASPFIEKLIEAHNEGKHPDVPKRQVLPTGDGQEFTASIMRLIREVYLDRIRDIIKGKS